MQSSTSWIYMITNQDIDRNVAFHMLQEVTLIFREYSNVDMVIKVTMSVNKQKN